MLELIQQRFQTVVLVALVFMLSAVFVLEFGGPQSDGCSSVNRTAFAARVYGETITEGDFRAAYAVTGFTRYPTKNARTLRLRELTLDGLVERELLAHEAESLGYRVDSEAVLRDFAEDGIVFVTPPVDAPAGYPGPELDVGINIQDDDGSFSMSKMQRFVNNHLRRSTEEFAMWQTRERLAAMMRETLTAEVTVSDAEVHDAYVRETDRARFRYAQFRPEFYASATPPTEEELTAWMNEHTEEVDAEYERQSFRYRGLDPEAHVRHILFSVAEGASDEERETVRAHAEDIRQQLIAGADFAAMAADESGDPGSASNGGEYDWTPRGRWVAPFEEAAFSQEIGAIGELVETRFGYHIIKVEGRREGDVPEDEARHELAEGLYTASRSGAQAREEAERALAFLREGHTMDELDERLLHRWEPVVAAVEAAPVEAAPVVEGEAPVEPEEEERPENAPEVLESRVFGRTESPITGAGSTGALTRAAFELTMDEPLPEEVIQVGTSFFVIELSERTEATEEGFTDEVRARLSTNLLEEKRMEAIRVYVHALRDRAEEAGALRTEPAILLYGDEVDEEAEPSDDDEEAEEEGEEGEEEESEGDEESALPLRRTEVPV